MTNPDIARILEGWAGLKAPEPTPQNIEAQYNQQLEEYAKCVDTARLFDTEYGKNFLADLEKKTIWNPAFDPQLPNPEYQGFHKEGQRSIVMWIKRRIEMAKEGPPPKPKELEGNDETTA